MSNWNDVSAPPDDSRLVLLKWSKEHVEVGRHFPLDGPSLLTGYATNNGNHYVGRIGIVEWAEVPQ